MKSPDRKHLHIKIFHENKDSEFQSKSKFHVISPAMKTANVNRFFNGET